MLRIYKTIGNPTEISEPERGCWVNVSYPSDDEKNRLLTEFGVPPDILQDILDVDERPRLEQNENMTLIIVRIPVASPNNSLPFYTVPLGVIITPAHTLTVCQIHNDVIPYEQPTLCTENRQQTDGALNFTICLSLYSAITYLKYLKQINQQTTLIEHELEKSIRNKELNKLLKMEKCLVFFITSLKTNELILNRLRSLKNHPLTGADQILLEDAIIENKQALEMAQIYSDIQTSMMDAFASVISNNLNVVLKRLTSISILLMIPTLIASVFGMNLPNFLEESVWAFPSVVGFLGLMSVIGLKMFRKKDWI